MIIREWHTADSAQVELGDKVGGIDLWTIPLERSEVEWRALAHILHPDEVARARRFRFDRDRRRYIVARASLRKILGHYLGLSPTAIRFEYGAHGKPTLSGEEKRLEFNLSHSGEKGLLGITPAGVGEIGVDIEFIDRNLWDVNETAETVFTPEEIAELQSYPKGERVDPFLAGWTRKEAYLKGIGKGLALPLKDFSVSLRPDATRPSLSAPGWQLAAFWESEAYIASVAISEAIEAPTFRYFKSA